MYRVALGLGLLLVVAAPADAAHHHRGNGALKRFCSGDAVTFCGDVDPGSRAMNACFRRNMRRLSPGCRRAIRSYKASGGR